MLSIVIVNMRDRELKDSTICNRAEQQACDILTFSRRQVEGPLTNPEPGKNEPSRPNTATAVVALRDDILRVRPALHLICCLSKAQATLVTTPRQHQS